MKAIHLYYVAPLAFMILTSSCEHKELCYNHPEHAERYESTVSITYNFQWEEPYDNLTDWQNNWDEQKMGFSYNSLKPGLPEGIRVAMYGEEPPRVVDNIGSDGGDIYMRPGKNSVIFYNNDTEYIVFDDMDNFASATATTRSRTRASYHGNKFTRQTDNRENTVAPPDELFGCYIDSYYQHKVTSPQQLDITMQPLVFTYVIRYEFDHGANYLGLARGALAGMAGSVSLSTGHTLPQRATLLYDAEVKPWGVEAIVKSFGIPDFPNENYSRSAEIYALNLEVRLRNGKIFTFDFDVTDQLRCQPHGGVITVNGLSISDEDGIEGGGSFDVTVDGWGEWEDINIDL